MFENNCLRTVQNGTDISPGRNNNQETIDTSEVLSTSLNGSLEDEKELINQKQVTQIQNINNVTSLNNKHNIHNLNM